jgi:predicted nucleotidyltransferase component of viral defense system
MGNQMILHENKTAFSELVKATSEKLGIIPIFVEMDYWITYVLKNLHNSEYHNKVVFKGGTSLSKGYDLIKRFSTDIDLAIIKGNDSTNNSIKTLIREIEKTICVGLKEIEESDNTSKGSKFRKSVYVYPKINEIESANSIIVEINSFYQPFPYKELEISSFIYRFLNSNSFENRIQEFGLSPFPINVLDKRQTLVEKLVSLIRFSYDLETIENIGNKIRHFYDLYYLMQDEECIAYVNTEAFKNDFTKILEHDWEVFDTPLGWQTKTVQESPLITNFSAIWSQLSILYTRELQRLSYSEIPNEKDVADNFEMILSRIG